MSDSGEIRAVNNSPSAGDRIASARRTLLLLIFTLTVITYLDRLAISAAMPDISREFGFTPTQKGYIFSSFSLAYALFEIPSGWLGDRFGARLALTRIVVWWSAMTSMTGAAVGYRSLMLIRFLFGAGEAGAFPNIARAVSRWFGQAEQGRALSISFLGLATGSTLTAPLVFNLLELQSWRAVFVELGLIGLVWAIAWHRWFRDFPEQHTSSGQPGTVEPPRPGGLETPLTGHLPWRTLLTSRNIIFISLMYFAYGYGLFFYVTWLPTYLIEARGFSTSGTRWLASLPWLISLPGYIFGGWITDRLARVGKLKLARCGVGIAGYLTSAVLLVMVGSVENGYLAAMLLAFALCAQTTTTSAAWAVCLDVGRQSAGTVTGTMNMIGNLGGAMAPLVVGIAVERFHSWTIPFYITAGVFLFSSMMWLFVDPARTLSAESS